jgi:CrcB protein
MSARTVEQAAAAHLRAAMLVVAVGGGVGSVLRYALAQAIPVRGHGFPVATLVTNLVGSLLLGGLVVAVTEIWAPHPLLRPLLGTGLLGGFTTFSTFAEQARALSAGTSTLYVLSSLVGGMIAAAAGMELIRLVEPRVHIAPKHEVLDHADPELP